MKRMYVTLGVMFLLVFWAFSSLGQKNSSIDQDSAEFQRLFKMREEMHRRMMDKLINGFGDDEDLFRDMEKLFDVPMMESMGPSSGQRFQAEWREEASGRTLEITPESPEQQLDIDVKKGFITIKGKSEVRSENGSSVSSFSNSFNVPGDCDASKVKMEQKDGKILVHFPYQDVKTVQAPPKDDRVPLPHDKSDIDI